MVRLTRLKIDRFRNVKPGTDLRFGPTFNVLLGKNATGKTSLLDLVAAVINDDLSAYAQEDAGFDLTWWLENGDRQLELRAERAPMKPRALPDGAREEQDFDDLWTMVLRIQGADAGRLEIAGMRGSWSAPGEQEELFEARSGLAVSRIGRRALNAAYQSYYSTRSMGSSDLPIDKIYDAAADMLEAERDPVGRFDEALSVLETITGSTFEWSRGTRGPMGRWLPTDFTIALNASKLQDPLVLISFKKLGTLSKIPALLGFVDADLYPRVLKRSKVGRRVTTTCQGFDCLFKRADGSQVSHALLSFGQKRLFAFLWYLAVRRQLPVVADELINGLHHEWIEICLDRLRERQSFLATQHPLLLDHIPIESAEAVRTTFIRCSTESGPDGCEYLAWRNFDEEEAERFFTAYQTGIQQVSEVLRSEGLW